jgi:orotate phosphoribosyltransferase
MLETHQIEANETLQKVLSPTLLQDTCSSVVGMIEESKVKFDAVAFTGLSGALVAPVVCLMLNKYPLVVRKDEEISHSYLRVEGPIGAFNYIIIDDLLCYGKTVRRMLNHIETNKPASKCVGLFLYNQKDSYNYFFGNNITEFSFPIWARNDAGIWRKCLTK